MIDEDLIDILVDAKTYFSVETYAQVIDELKLLLPLHWQELAAHEDIPLDPEFEVYRRANEADLLAIYTARSAHDRRLCGYSIFWVRPSHPHYKQHSWAMNDIVWLAPEHRNLGIGKQFVAFWDADLRQRGVSVVHVNAKVKHPALMYLLKSCGYETIEAGLEKRLI